MIAQTDFVMYMYWVKKLELASFLYVVFPGPLGQCISVTYPRRTLGPRDPKPIGRAQ